MRAAKPTGIHGVVLIVPDLEAARTFYEETLNLELVHDYGDALFFKCGDQALALFAKGHHAEGDKRLGGADHGVSHLEFTVGGRGRRAIEARLREAGAETYADNFEDPAGFLFHFVDA